MDIKADTLLDGVLHGSWVVFGDRLARNEMLRKTEGEVPRLSLLESVCVKTGVAECEGERKGDADAEGETEELELELDSAESLNT